MEKLYNEIFKMKTLLRRGWVLTNSPDKATARYESDAEHVFSVAMLALAIISKENLKLDMEKVFKMIMYHDLCEIDAGDHTIVDSITKQEKFDLEQKCIDRLASEYDMPEIKSIWHEFEENSTPEAQFVKKIDKLDAIMQSKIYSKQKGDSALFDEFYGNGKNLVGDFKKYV